MTNTTEHPHAPEPHAEVGQVQRPVRPDVERVMRAVWDLVRSGPNYDGRQHNVEAAIAAAIDRAVAADRHRISALMEAHTGIRLATVEYLEMMRQGPTPEEWAELDARARGDGEPGCRDCADNNGTCPHDGHKCGA